MKTILLIIFSSIGFFYSCKNKGINESKLTLLQHKWIIDSSILYESPLCKGIGVLSERLQGDCDFRKDNKVYSRISIGSDSAITFYDTAIYKMKDNFIERNPIVNNKPLTLQTNIRIDTLTDKIMVLCELTKDINGKYAKIYWHR